MQVRVALVVDDPHDLHDLLSMLIGSCPEAVLNHITGVLVLRVHQNFLDRQLDEFEAIFCASVIHDILNDIVAILIYDEVQCACVKFFNDLVSCLIRAEFQHTLDDTAAIRVRSQVVDVTRDCIVDEDDMLRRDALNGLLYDVIAILVFDAVENIGLELLHESRLLVGKDVFECLERSDLQLQGKQGMTYLLNDSATIHLQGEIGNVALHLICHLFLLCLVAMLEELLYHIIAKYIRH